MFNPIKPINSLYKEIIDEEVSNIQRITNSEVYINHLNNLYIDCLICSETLKKLSLNCIQAMQYLKNSKEQSKYNDFSFLRTFSFKRNYKRRQKTINFFKKINFILFTIFFAPIFLFFWAIKDPYEKQFCSFHFHLRPIKKERIRRFFIYILVSLIWVLVITLLILFFYLKFYT